MACSDTPQDKVLLFDWKHSVHGAGEPAPCREGASVPPASDVLVAAPVSSSQVLVVDRTHRLAGPEIFLLEQPEQEGAVLPVELDAQGAVGGVHVSFS